MNNKLLIKILESLERIYPESCSLTSFNKLRPVEDEFCKIIKYLEESGKIKISYEGSCNQLGLNDMWYRNNKIKINIKGIEFLKQKKLLMINEKRKEIIKWATIIIAIATAITLFLFIFRK